MTPAIFATALLNYCDATTGTVREYIRSASCARDRTGGEHCAHRYGLGADVVYDVPPTSDAAVARGAVYGLRVARGLGYDHVEPLVWAMAGDAPACVAITAGIKKPGARAGGRFAASVRLEPVRTA